MHQLKKIEMTIEQYNPSILNQTSWKGIKLNGALNLCVKKLTEKNVSPSKTYFSSKLICTCVSKVREALAKRGCKDK